MTNILKVQRDLMIEEYQATKLAMPALHSYMAEPHESIPQIEEVACAATCHM